MSYPQVGLGGPMGRIFIVVVAVLAFSFAYQEYTGKSVVQSFQTLSFGGAGGGFAGGYGLGVDSGRSIGQSVGGLASGVANRIGITGN
ncbi:MAG: hypothetical protein ACR2O1_08315 [Boseongicola sp.]